MRRGSSTRFALLALMLSVALPGAALRAQVIDGVAAIVDKDVVLLSDVELSARIAIDRIERQRGPLPPEAVQEVFKDALQNLIDTRLIMQYARRANLSALPVEIDRAVENIAADEGVTPDAVYRAAAAQGLARESYRRELGVQLTRMKVMSGAVRARVTVSDDDVQALFHERYSSQKPGMRVRARHILLPWPEQDEPEQLERMRQIAEQIRERAIETGDFGALAQQYSRAPSRVDGGLTTFSREEVAPRIRDVVFELPPGEVTPVIETDHGLNIFQIVNRFDPAEVRYEDVEASLRAELVESKVKPGFEEWVGKLREHRYIEILSPELR